MPSPRLKASCVAPAACAEYPPLRSAAATCTASELEDVAPEHATASRLILAINFSERDSGALSCETRLTHASSVSDAPPGAADAPSSPLRVSEGSAGGGPAERKEHILPGTLTAELPTPRSFGVWGPQASRGASSPSSSLSNSDAKRSVHGG